MAKPGKGKKACEKYARSGHKELNKKLRKERDEKRRKKFEQRKAEGKAYEYKPNPYEKGTKEYYREAELRKNKLIEAKNNKTDFQRTRSIFAKLENEVEAEKKATKAAEEKGGKRNEKYEEDY